MRSPHASVLARPWRDGWVLECLLFFPLRESESEGYPPKVHKHPKIPHPSKHPKSALPEWSNLRENGSTRPHRNVT